MSDASRVNITGSEQHPPTACWSCGAGLPQPSKRAEQSEPEVRGCDESKMLRALIRRDGVELTRVARLLLEAITPAERCDLAAALLALGDNMARVPDFKSEWKAE